MDGIDEIFYHMAQWTMTYHHAEKKVYAPKYDEWFSLIENIFYDDEGICTRSVTYSENLEEENYIPFKEFLKLNEPNSCESP